MCSCSKCESSFEVYEEYHKVEGEDVALCENCYSEIVNDEFCDLMNIRFINVTAGIDDVGVETDYKEY